MMIIIIIVAVTSRSSLYSINTYLSNEFQCTREPYSRVGFCVLLYRKNQLRWMLAIDTAKILLKRADEKEMKCCKLITFSKYISKNLFFAASGLNPSTPFTEATPPKKFASPGIINIFWKLGRPNYLSVLETIITTLYYMHFIRWCRLRRLLVAYDVLETFFFFW